MNPSRRYFRLTGSLRKMADEWKSVVWTQHVQDRKTFCAEAGTSDMMLRGRRLVAINSETSLPGLIADKAIPGYSKPNRRTKAGKQLANKLSSLTTPVPEKLLNLVTPERSWTVGTYFCHSAMSYLSDEYFISVPTEIKYQPHDEMIEIFEWQYMKLEAEVLSAKDVKATN